ncbi:ATP-grasp domain-containing protein [Fructilactobacillus vespulae]|uniref:ATP-grasp domain-containing protein n=1 Tax=Fructilactobacillus vespulae TaxID=1249630 RepID=UPI0039B552B3
MDSNYLHPGATVGIIGDNINACQFAKEGRNLGFKVGLFTGFSESKIRQYVDFVVVGDPNDEDKLTLFADRCDLITYASEFVSVDAIEFLEKRTNVLQGTDLLEITQDRALEHAFFDQININGVPYSTVVDVDDVKTTIDSIGYPAILKPILKSSVGQESVSIKTPAEISNFNQLFEYGSYLLESDVEYKREFSVQAVRAANGSIEQFPVLEVTQMGGVTRVINTNLADIADVVAEIKKIVAKIGDNINYIGLYGVKFGLDSNQTLYVRNISASGDSEAYIFNQSMNVSAYQQHFRAIANYPLMPIKKYQDVILQSFMPDQLMPVLDLVNQHSDWGIRFEIQCILIATDDVAKNVAVLDNNNL